MRIVLDTNILVRANPKTSQGLGRDLLLTIIHGPHALILSQPILIEVQRVLTYPHVQARWPLTQGAIEHYLSFLESAGEMVELLFSPAVVMRDPDDDPILQTAVSGRADVLCTRDRHSGIRPWRKIAAPTPFVSWTISPSYKSSAVRRLDTV